MVPHNDPAAFTRWYPLRGADRGGAEKAATGDTQAEGVTARIGGDRIRQKKAFPSQNHRG